MMYGHFGTHQVLSYLCGLCQPKPTAYRTAEEKARHLESVHRVTIRAHPSGGYVYTTP